MQTRIIESGKGWKIEKYRNEVTGRWSKSFHWVTDSAEGYSHSLRAAEQDIRDSLKS